MSRSRKPLYAALLSAAFVTGCAEIGTIGTMSLLPTDTTADAPLLATATVARGQITIAGPNGYCIDPATLRSTASGGFAAIASCHILSDGTEGPIVEPVLVTVTVSPADKGEPSPAELADALGTTLLQSRELSGLAVGQMADGGAEAFSGSDPKHWRGAFVLGRHLIGVTLYAPEGSPLLGSQGAAFLNTVSSAIRAKSDPGPAVSAQQSQSAVDPLTQRLGRLFARRDL